MSFLETLHVKIFGHEMSDQMRLFLVHLSWSLFSGIIALSITVIVMTLAGRLMGPTEYGRLNLLLIFNQFLVLAVFLGLDITTVKFIARAKNDNDIRKSISSSFYYVVSFLLFLVIVAAIFGSKISDLSGLSKQFIFVLVFYTIVVSIKAIFDVSIRGLGKFKIQALAKLIEVSTVLLFFIVVFLFLGIRNYAAYALIISFGALIISSFYFMVIKKYLFGFSFKILAKQINDGKYYMLSALLATVFLSSDRIIIAKFIDIKTLGIYSAYYAASFSLAASLSQLFVNVFFPMSAKSEDKSFFRKIDRLFLVGILPFYILACFLIYIALMVFGKDYPLRFDYLSLFAVVSVLYFFQSLYNTIILDSPQRIYRVYLLYSYAINLLTIAYYLVIIRTSFFSINFILLGLIINLVFVLFLQRSMIKRCCLDSLKKNHPSVSIGEK